MSNHSNNRVGNRIVKRVLLAACVIHQTEMHADECAELTV